MNWTYTSLQLALRLSTTSLAGRVRGSARCLFVAAALFELSGCANMPNQIAQPEISQPDQASQAAKLKARYALNGKSVIYGQSFSGSSAILPLETNLVGLQSQVMAMRGAYADRQAYLLKQIDGASNIQLGGILLAVAGVAADEIGLRNTGAGAAGLSTFWTNHYQLNIQATNYGLAAQAMGCLYKEISALPASFWSSAYDAEGVFQVAKSDLGMSATPAEESTAYDALSRMYLLLHDAVDNVDQKLRSLQSGVTIAKVSASDIQEAAAWQNTAEATGKAIGTDQAKGAARASAVTAAGQAEKADAAAKLSILRAQEAERNVAHVATETETAKDKASLAQQELVDAENALIEFQNKNGRLPRSETEEEEKTLVSQRNAARRAVAAVGLKVAALEKKLQAAKDKASKLAEKAGKDRVIAEIARKTADQKKTWENLVASGIASRAAQLPAKANACVVAMGK